EIVSSYRCPQPTDAQSNGIRVRVLTGIDDVVTSNGLYIFPNPNSGNFTISGIATANKSIHLEVVNAVGQVIYTGEVVPKSGTLNEQVNLGNVPDGIYLLRINTGNERWGIRFR